MYHTPGLVPGRSKGFYKCDYNQPPPDGGVCDVDVTSLEPCTKENNYGYKKRSPCIFFKFQGNNTWVPEYYNSSKDLPEEMPSSLKNHISEIEKTQIQKMNTIWISCQGEKPVDEENIGPLNYLPYRGFPGYYYPDQNLEGYLSPLVAVQFERPLVGVIIKVECKVWVRNIDYDHKELKGSVRFELFVD